MLSNYFPSTRSARTAVVGACTRARKKRALVDSSILAPDIVVMVLVQLDHVADLISASRVCTVWRACAALDLVWSRGFADNVALRGRVEDIVRTRSSLKQFTLDLVLGRPLRSPCSLSPVDFVLAVRLGGGERHTVPLRGGGGGSAVATCPVQLSKLPVGFAPLRAVLSLNVDLVRCSDGASVALATDWEHSARVYDDGQGGAISCTWDEHPIDELSVFTAHTYAHRKDCDFGAHNSTCPCTPCMLQLPPGVDWALDFTPIAFTFLPTAAHNMARLPLCGAGGLLDLFHHLADAAVGERRADRTPRAACVLSPHVTGARGGAMLRALELVLAQSVLSNVRDFRDLAPKLAALCHNGLEIVRSVRTKSLLAHAPPPALDASVSPAAGQIALAHGRDARAQPARGRYAPEDIVLLVKVSARELAVSDLEFVAGDAGEYMRIDLTSAQPALNSSFLVEPRARMSSSVRARISLRVHALCRHDGHVLTILDGEAARAVAVAVDEGEPGWRFEFDGWSTGERSRFHPLCRVAASLLVADTSAGATDDFATLVTRFCSGGSGMSARELHLSFHAGVPFHPVPVPAWTAARSSAQVASLLERAFLADRGREHRHAHEMLRAFPRRPSRTECHVSASLESCG